MFLVHCLFPEHPIEQVLSKGSGLNEDTQQKFASSLHSHSSTRPFCKTGGDAYMGVRSRELQGARSQTQGARVVEAGDAGGAESLRDSPEQWGKGLDGCQCAAHP